jgi:glycosyltransferase involved in cell wall biosynthesis
MEKQNKFRIITPSYNNEEWVEYNLASILNQTYTNYKVTYIDDASTDSTYEKVKEIVGELPNWNVIKNSENKGATYNYFHNLNDYVEDPNEIIVHLDGDDWLYDETVLEKLNNFYNEKDCWMTYGGFIVWNGLDAESTLPYPQSTEHSDFVHKHKLYRQDHWRASHLRTYRAFLVQAINLPDLQTLEDGKYYWHAGDLAIQYPCMEMCPKDKIQVVDFFDCVYNHSKANQVRTHERESKDNTKYEIEIRNRKKYKENLSGEKLPQINVLGNFREKNSIPGTFSYTYNLSDGEFDITLIEDTEILKYVKGDIKVNRGLIVADVHEAPHLLSQNEVYTAVKENSQMFDLILTFDKELLKLPNAVFRNGGYEVVLNKNVHKAEHPLLQDDSLIQIYKDKSKHISFITSNKVMTEGHRFRVGCAQKIIDLRIPNVDFYGVGLREIQGKIEGLKDYKFSIAIENGVHDNYFTEKILDCFLTGTIPIYRGCPNIGEFFNTKGFLIFDKEEELLELVNNLTKEDYYSREKYIKENFEKAKQYAYNNDQLFEKYFKKLINV